MKPATRKWLMGLIENSGNTKAIEVRDYILELESRLEGLEIDDDIDPETQIYSIGTEE
jgi:hypothetical protein